MEEEIVSLIDLFNAVTGRNEVKCISTQSTRPVDIMTVYEKDHIYQYHGPSRSRTPWFLLFRFNYLYVKYEWD